MRTEAVRTRCRVVVAAALAAGLTGCTGGSSADGDAADAKSGGADRIEPAPTRAATRPCPRPAGCRRARHPPDMLPGAGQLPDGHRGAEGLRRPGRHHLRHRPPRRLPLDPRDAPRRTRHLGLDIQRVVSYDSAVSDDDKAQAIYGKKELAARIPSGGTGSPSPAAPSPPAPPPPRRARQRAKESSPTTRRTRAQRARARQARRGRPRPGAPRRSPTRARTRARTRAAPPPPASWTTSGTRPSSMTNWSQRTPAYTAMSRGLPHVERHREDHLRPVVHGQDDAAGQPGIAGQGPFAGHRAVRQPQRIVRIGSIGRVDG